MQLLVVDPPDVPLPAETLDGLELEGWTVLRVADYSAALQHTRRHSVDAVLLSGPGPAADASRVNEEFNDLVRSLDAQRTAAIVLDGGGARVERGERSLVDVVRRDISAAELRGRLAMIDRYHAHLCRFEEELRGMERVGKRLNEQFREVDLEMQLAARIQRHFLPSVVEPIGRFRFASTYRPASWVSGDIFDIFRIDEDHTGFYVADVVGHGMAASLLTLFIKRAIVPKEVQGSSYRILTPAEALAGLNETLVAQRLPNYQFVTACYAVLDHAAMTLTYARGGHPFPLLIPGDGAPRELKTAGGLVGIFENEAFAEVSTPLQSGDKVLFYTDGVELAFQDGPEPAVDPRAFLRTFESLAHLPIDAMVRGIERHLDDESGSLHPRDDVTILGLEVLAAQT